MSSNGMDTLKNLLGKQQHAEPAEVKIIKDYVIEKFDHEPRIMVQQQQIIIGVPNAALAGALRMHLHELQALCQTKKRLVIRIS